MRRKGFDKPVKYLFIGKANLTKTTLAGKIGLSVFETDGLKDPNNLDEWDLTKEIIIIGGKHINNYPYGRVIEKLKDYQVIILFFMKGN